MIRTYLEFAKKSFQNNIVYRVDYLAGVINAIVMIFVNISIWKAIYGQDEVMGGIQFKMLTTYIVLSFIIQCVFMMDEFLIENKVKSGLISSDLLKPINFRLYIFSYNMGTLLFRLVMQMAPALIVSIIFFGLQAPFSLSMGIYFFISIFLGYLVLYNLNFIVWITSFWFYGNFSLVTIKDAAVMIFSGALLPLWFMPPAVADFIALTPFKSIYFVPISIYLGYVPGDEIVSNILLQLGWAAGLFVLGQVLWSAAQKKLVIQGG